MPYLAFALSFVGGLAATCYLVVNGHPWWAGAVLVIVGTLHVKDGKDRPA